MNKPYSYVLFHYFGFLGRIVPNLVVNLLIGMIAAWLLVGPVVFTLQGVLLGALLLFFGYALDFLMSLIIGLLAFWVEDTTAFTWNTAPAFCCRSSAWSSTILL